jgi:hypothetical protein
VNHDLRRIFPGLVLFENRLGGRVATLPYSFHAIEQDISHLICYQRRHQLKSVFNWLNSKTFPVWLISPADIGVHLWKDDKRITICLSNLSFDCAEEISLEINIPSLVREKVNFIAENGEIVSLTNRIVEESAGAGRRIWRMKLELKPFSPAVLILEL